MYFPGVSIVVVGSVAVVGHGNADGSLIIKVPTVKKMLSNLFHKFISSMVAILHLPPIPPALEGGKGTIIPPHPNQMHHRALHSRSHGSDWMGYLGHHSKKLTDECARTSWDAMQGLSN
jgi:hypothetical protein